MLTLKCADSADTFGYNNITISQMKAYTRISGPVHGYLSLSRNLSAPVI